MMANDFLFFLAETQSGGWLESLGLLSLGNAALLWARVGLGIGLVIFVHELGHFVAAKTFGVKCEKFYVGFDPPMKIGPIKLPSSLGKFRYGETEYGIGIIPLGGYVKMLGQDDDPRRMREEAERARAAAEDEGDPAIAETPPLDPRSLPAKPVWQRMIIMSAGVFMNIVTGILFAAGAYFAGVPYTPAVIGGVAAGGPAWKAGIQPGGQVISVDGIDDEQMHFREMRSAILHAGLETPDRPIPVTLAYDEQQTNYTLMTQSHPQEEKLRMIGISASSSRFLDKSMPAMLMSSAAGILSENEGGAELVSFDDQAIDPNSISPVDEFLDYLHTHPRQPISLTFKRQDQSTYQAILPPQISKWIGLRLTVGEVSDLVESGPAEVAGMKVGDVIVSVDDSSIDDSEGLLLALADRTATRFEVKRGEEIVSLVIQPDGSLQTLPPADSNAVKASVNAYGFAIELPAVVAAMDNSIKVSGDELEAGATLREIQLLGADELPDEYGEPLIE
ncbi:MAG: site-2 protease family protein, partial [Planctomycetota bacterium]